MKLNQLSKLKVIFTLCSVILLAGCAGGAGDSGDSSGADYSQFDNSTLNFNLELKDSCTIRNLDLNGNVVLVKAKGVVLDGAKNGKVIVDSSVGDGDFTMKNCKGIKNVTVNGGGSNSLHFLNSVIDALVASKENVRLVLEGQSKITNVEVKASGVKLQGSTESEIAKVSISISKTVTAIEVNGGSISSIIAAGKIEVKISSSETKIEFIKSVKNVVVTKDAGVNLETEPVKTGNNSEVATEYEKIEEASEIKILPVSVVRLTPNLPGFQKKLQTAGTARCCRCTRKSAWKISFHPANVFVSRCLPSRIFIKLPFYCP